MKEFVKNFWNKIKQPKGWKLAVSLLLIVSIITATILLVIFIPKHTVFHFVLYVASAISLAYLIYLIIYLTPIMKKEFKHIMSKNKYTNKFVTSYGFRAFIFAICSFCINVGYVVLMGIVSIVIKSPWFGIFAVYYLILSIMRGSVLWSKKKRIKNEEKTYLAVAISLLALTIAAAALVILTNKETNLSRFEGLLIYCSAAYTFYKLGLSIYNIIKAKRQDSLLVESVKDISFVDALVSIFVLQVSMIQTFSSELWNKTIAINALTGFLVCLGIVAVAVLMIVKYVKIKRVKKIAILIEEVATEEDMEEVLEN